MKISTGIVAATVFSAISGPAAYGFLFDIPHHDISRIYLGLTILAVSITASALIIDIMEGYK